MKPLFVILSTAALLLGVSIGGDEDHRPEANANANDDDHLDTLAVPVIHQRPIPFGELRRDLTLAYIRRHYDSMATEITIEPEFIVIHWTGSPSLESALATFAPEKLPSYRSGIASGGWVNVSAHFVVDRDGTIYQVMPADWMARHVIGLNRIAIGIENPGGPDWPLTQAQLVANEELIRYLCGRFPEIRYLIGHHEYLRFRETPLWEEMDSTYVTYKQDPGKPFMEALRGRVGDLELLDSWIGTEQ